MHDLLSEPRKARFISFFKTCNNDELQGVYRWHQTVSSSFLAILNDFEVVLRNAIHFSISNHYDTQANDSFDWMGVSIINAGNSPNRICHRLSGRREKNNSQQGYTYTGSLGKIEDAVKQLRRDRKHITVDAVVAELSFGFWPTVLSDLKKNYRNQSREQILKAMFPHANRHDIQFIEHIGRLLKQIRLFRNRCGHHDSLLSFPEISTNGDRGFFPRKPRHTINSLTMLLERIRLVLSWVDDKIVVRLNDSDHWHRLEQLLCKDMLGYFRFSAGNANSFVNGLHYKSKIERAKLIKAKKKGSNPKFPIEMSKIENYYV